MVLQRGVIMDGKTKAILAGVLGIVSFLGNWAIPEEPVPVIIVLAMSIAALVLGIQARNAEGGKVMAWIGIVAGGLLCVLLLIAFFIGMGMGMAG